MRVNKLCGRRSRPAPSFATIPLSTRVGHSSSDPAPANPQGARATRRRRTLRRPLTLTPYGRRLLSPSSIAFFPVLFGCNTEWQMMLGALS